MARWSRPALAPVNFFLVLSVTISSLDISKVEEGSREKSKKGISSLKVTS